MLITILGILALLAAILLWTALSSYFRFVKLCRLVAIVEDAMSELNSSDGLDGNSTNRFERAQLSRVWRGSFVGYVDPEIELLATQLKRNFIAMFLTFGSLSLMLLSLIFLSA